MRITDLPTPQVLIEQSRLRANIERMQAAAHGAGLALRPHAKTHKSPAVASLQIEAGATGICCAKVGEAEVFVDAGIPDVRLAFPVQPSNVGRLRKLMDRAAVSIVVDHPGVAGEWSSAMRRMGRRLDVLVKVDVGFHRCGIDPEASGALGFVERVAGLLGLNFRGFLSHAGHAYSATSEAELAAIARAEAAILAALAAALRDRGVPVHELSVGATPTARYSVQQAGLTELRPGNYVYYDRTQIALGAASVKDCALTVMATVVSKPAEDRIILDCGSKTLSSDPPRGFCVPVGYGALFTDLEEEEPDEGFIIERLSEEHATVRVAAGSTPLRPGDRVRVLPNHSCVVSNLVDCVRITDGLDVVETLPVAARGKVA